MPPPFGGFSVASENMALHLESLGFNIILINRSISLKKAKAFSYLYYLASLFLKLIFLGDRRCLLYVQLSGGYGQLLDLLIISLFSLFCRALILHHHSFSYVSTPSFLAKLVFSFPLPLTHICQCDQMITLLRELYPRDQEVTYLRLSNTAYNKLLSSPSSSTLTTATSSELSFYEDSKLNLGHNFNIGFLSGPILEKGLDDTIIIVNDLIDKGLSPTLHLAGGSLINYEKLIRQICLVHDLNYSHLPLKFHGFLSRPQVSDLITSLDVLMIPTRYKNEVEPLVILESYGHGVPVVAYPVGCISDILAPSSPTRVMASRDSLRKSSTNFLIRLASQSDYKKAVSNDCIRFYQHLLSKSMLDLDRFNLHISSTFKSFVV